MTNNDGYDALQLHIWTAGPDGALTFVNHFSVEYFGRSREQLIGEGWQNVLHSTDLPVAIERWAKSIESGAPYEVDSRPLRASDRTYRWIRAAARRVMGPQGVMWVGSDIDIGAERRATETMQAWRVRAIGRVT